jgi:hypothetical protein
MEIENKEINKLLDETILLLNQYREIFKEYNEYTLKEKYHYYSYEHRLIQIENIKLLLKIDLDRIKIIDNN